MNMYGTGALPADAKHKKNRPFVHLMIPRFTGVCFPPGAVGGGFHHRYYAHIVSDDLATI